jgi:hypothetical protein
MQLRIKMHTRSLNRESDITYLLFQTYLIFRFAGYGRKSFLRALGRNYHG